MSDRRSPTCQDPELAAVHAALEADSTLAAGTAFAALVADYVAATAARAEPVFTPHTPAALAARFDEPLPQGARPLADVLAQVARDVLPDCNRLLDPRYMGHQVSAPLPAAIWAEALTGALNQSGAVWEMSPVGTVIETQVIRWMSDLAGLGPDAGGTFTSGVVSNSRNRSTAPLVAAITCGLTRTTCAICRMSCSKRFMIASEVTSTSTSLTC